MGSITGRRKNACDSMQRLEDTWSVRRTLSRLCLRIVFSVVTSDLLCRGPSMHQATPRTLRGQVIELAVDYWLSIRTPNVKKLSLCSRAPYMNIKSCRVLSK